MFAETSQRRHDGAEDLLCATMRFENDANGLLEVNWLTPTKVRELSVTVICVSDTQRRGVEATLRLLRVEDRVRAYTIYNPVDDAIEAARSIPDAALVRLGGNAGHAVAADSSPQLTEVRGAISEFLIRRAG